MKYSILFIYSILFLSIFSQPYLVTQGFHKGRIVTIKGPIQELLPNTENLPNAITAFKSAITTNNQTNIDNVFKQYPYLRSSPLLTYVFCNPPPIGTIYVGTVDDQHYFFHESWIKKIEISKSRQLKLEKRKNNNLYRARL